MSQGRMLHHATRMAAVTFVSRITGYVRDKALAWALGADALNDAFRTAFRIPNAFRALLAEGALHAAFVPALAQLRDDGEEGRRARELVRGVTAALLLVLALVVGIGIAAAGWLVRLYAEGFSGTPGKIQLTVLMTRIMFPYLGLISMAALCQGVLNSRERFLLPAATPILFNLTVAAVAWLAVGGGGWEDPRVAGAVLGGAVLCGGALQLVVQLPAVRRIGFDVRPALRLVTSSPVRQVVLLMVPGVAVLGLNQVNQLVTSRFASFLGDGAVTAQVYAFRVTELMYGGLVVQLTTVLLPVLARQLRTEPARAHETLVETLRLVTFVTLPSATLLAVIGDPVIGLLFGGGRFSPGAVAVTGATLSAYSFSLVGTALAKVMASSFFARRNTRAPMWGTAATLLVFTGLCFILVRPLGVPGLGLANTLAMAAYAGLLGVMYVRRYGWGGASPKPLVAAVSRQLVASAAVAAGLLWLRPVLETVRRTGLEEAVLVGSVVVAAAGLYTGVVRLLGGTEPGEMIRAVTGRRSR